MNQTQEEDFRTNTGGFSLQEKLTEQDAVQGLTQGEEEMVARIKATKAEGKDGGDAEILWVNACLARMRLRRGCQNLWLHREFCPRSCTNCSRALDEIVFDTVRGRARYPLHSLLSIHFGLALFWFFPLVTNSFISPASSTSTLG